MRQTNTTAKKMMLVLLLSCACCSLIGCIESTFDLANGSRLPGWYTPPPGLTRADISVTLDYMTSGQDIFIFRDSHGKKLSVMYAQKEFWLSGTRYHVLTVNDVTEVVRLRPYEDHQGMVQNGHIVALLYLVDDPAIKKEVLEAQARSIENERTATEKPITRK